MLSALKLRHVRCFETLECAPAAGTTIFVGPNAQGKTTILEAVCLVLRLQSPRASNLGEILRFSTQEMAISAVLDDQELLFGFSEKTRRRLKVDGEALRNSTDYLRQTALVVWMANDDLSLVRGSGEVRRRFLDFMGSQLYPAYRPALRAYDRSLRSRNFLLKRDASPNWAQIDAYTRVLVEHGLTLHRCRGDMIARLEPFAAQVQREISARDEVLRLTYQASGGEELERTLAEARPDELKRRSTAAGPHRDDLELSLDERPAARFASEGQQRTLALALKLGQARLFESARERPPILLLDDIFGELDAERRNALMAALPANAQKLVTTTALTWLEDHLHPDKRFRVGDGLLHAEA